MPSAPALLLQLGPARPLEVCKHALKALAEMMSLLVHFPWGSSSSKKGGPKSLHPALTGAAPHNPRSQGCLGCGCPPWLRARSARGLLHQAGISWVYFSSYLEKHNLNFWGEMEVLLQASSYMWGAQAQRCRAEPRRGAGRFHLAPQNEPWGGGERNGFSVLFSSLNHKGV